jgi:hypothetical protein
VAINIHLMDTYVHALDAELAETALSMSKEMGLDNFRTPGVFGPEVPCDESDAAHRRLLAYLGRTSERSRRAICSGSPK